LVDLTPGAYTVILSGNEGSVGVGLVEVYDLSMNQDSKLANISTRGFVATGGDIMIAGFILGGNNTGQDNIVMRGIGPSLSAFGIPNVLANPQLELRNSTGTLIRSNDDWIDDPDQKTLIMNAGLAPSNNLESAIYETLAPGQYTALLSGVNNGTGVGLIEAYDLATSGPAPSATPTATAAGSPGPTPTPGGGTPTPTPSTCTENFDEVIAPVLPNGWAASNPIPGDGVMFSTTTMMPDSAPNAAFIPAQDGISDKVLDRINVSVHSDSAILTFRNKFNTEGIQACSNGGVLEVSTPNISHGDFFDVTDPHIGGTIAMGGYTCEISSSGNPLFGRMAWSGDSAGYTNTVIQLGPNLVGQTITLRFRFGSDDAITAPGWWIDTLSITDASCP
jgi:hypothetical protein